MTWGASLAGSHWATTELSSVWRRGGGGTELTQQPCRDKNPYCANSIRGKQEKRRGEWETGGTRDGGRQRQGGGGQLAALPSLPAVCEKAAVAYWGLHNILRHICARVHICTHVWMHMDIHSSRCRSSALSSGASSSHCFAFFLSSSWSLWRLREGSPSRSGLDHSFKSPVSSDFSFGGLSQNIR